jgi:hypothetical protein
MLQDNGGDADALVGVLHLIDALQDAAEDAGVRL